MKKKSWVMGHGSWVRKAVSLLLAGVLLTAHHPRLTTAFAADEAAVLSLPALLDELKAKNPDLLAARKQWEAAQARIPLSRGLPAPRIGIEFEEIPRGTVKLDQANLMFQLIQSLPFPGKLSLRQQVAVKEAQMAAAAYKKAQWETRGMLKSVYYDLFLLDRELELQEEALLWLRQAAATAEARYATGSAPQAEPLQAQAEWLEAANAAGVLGHRRLAMSAHVNHLLNRSAAEEVGAPGPIPLTPLPASVDELVALAEQNQPDLLAFKFSAERSEAAWKLSKRELLPDLETMFELRNPAAGPIGPWDLTLALVLPFWFWTKQSYGVKAALFDKESAQAAYQGMRNEITRRIHEQWHEVQAAYDTARLCQESLIPLAQQAVASALAAYQGGRGSFLELLEALRALTERERTYYQHLAALEQHLVMLEQSAGVPLRERNQETKTGGAS
ncbi:MAG: TolC family protein [Candidatus Omnitrophica bacterium]|nr:TolC family protein [Candidatus Omnitrophota bacterium]